MISQRSVLDLGTFRECIREVVSHGESVCSGEDGKVCYALTNTLQVLCLEE